MSNFNSFDDDLNNKQIDMTDKKTKAPVSVEAKNQRMEEEPSQKDGVIQGKSSSGNYTEEISNSVFNKVNSNLK